MLKFLMIGFGEKVEQLMCLSNKQGNCIVDSQPQIIVLKKGYFLRFLGLEGRYRNIQSC